MLQCVLDASGMAAGEAYLGIGAEVRRVGRQAEIMLRVSTPFLDAEKVKQARRLK
jgi:hypothetical protein